MARSMHLHLAYGGYLWKQRVLTANKIICKFVYRFYLT